LDPNEITTLRESLGWSRPRFASALGVAQNTIWRWENGQAIPSQLHEATMYRLQEELEKRKTEEGRSEFSQQLGKALLVGGIMLFLAILFSSGDQ